MEIQFNEADAITLEKYYGNWQTLRDAGYIKMLDPWVRQEYFDITRRALDPRTIICLTCPEDVMNMIRVLYTNYDKWKARQVQADPEPPAQVDPPAPEIASQEPFIFPDGLDSIEPLPSYKEVTDEDLKKLNLPMMPSPVPAEQIKKKGRPKK